MTKSNNPKNHARLLILGTIGAALLLVLGWLVVRGPSPVDRLPEPPAAARTIPEDSVIDFNQIQTDPALKKEMDSRKESYGVGEGIDIIAKSDETVRIGDRTVAMADIARKIETKEGRIIETNLASPESGVNIYGLYVVQPGDNIWNIHFRILKDYFSRKGIQLAPQSDEPGNQGASSGVGRLLKFSERMVYIYNLRDNQLDADLDLILPLSKVVIYNMERVFSMLDAIDYSRVNHIRFDGDNLWIPAHQ